jgi:aspartate aminotransferase-like enzyme/phosphoglycerate dehydrogenase-like enzyme
MRAPLSLLPRVVADTIEHSYGHHRTPWFEGILERIGVSLAGALGARVPLILTATTGGAREAVVANCVAPGGRVWTSPGSAFVPLVETWGGNPIEWSDRTRFEEHGGDGPPLVLLDHVHTSGAVLNLERAVESIQRASSEALIVLDASVSFGADVATFEMLGIDAVLLAPEGALMGIPGLTIVAAGTTLLDHVRRCRKNLQARPFYFDLLRYEKSWAKRTTPFSPDISASIALAKALELIEANGGLRGQVEQHAARAASVRRALTACGLIPVLPEAEATNAFTIVDPARGVDDRALDAASSAGAHVQSCHDAAHPHRIRIDHTGYLPEGTLARAIERLGAGRSGSPAAADGNAAGLPSVADLRFANAVPADIPPANRLPIFDIPAEDFAAQAAVHAARLRAGAAFERRIGEAARATFRHPHRFNERTLTSRTIGFIGAGNITRNAVEKCRQLGIRRLMVYSPSLAQGARADAEDHKGTDYWKSRDVVVAATAAEIFREAHTIVLLPWFYDQNALDVFGRGDAYLNHGLISAEVLQLIEREGLADLLINAAARGALIDRAALGRAVADGWLRYYSDELPKPDDPLLALPEARFTGHVGGSCAQPQAAVARNTHRILRQLVPSLTSGHELQPGTDAEYTINVINAALDKPVPWRSAGRGGAVPIRILITDSFDVPSLGFDRLRARGHAIDVLDVSAEQPDSAAVAGYLRTFRPHILMLRSRTKVDHALASVAGEVTELAAVVRPGVGIDNLYGGVRELTRLGVRIINEPFGNSSAVAEMTLHFILSAAEETLLAPGPTRFRPEVFAVTDRYEHPANPAFQDAEAQLRQRISAWFLTSAETVVVSGSGTALMEAGVVNLTGPDDRGVVISHGKFGDRFADIAQARGRAVDLLRVDEPDWGRAITPDDLKAHLDLRARAGEKVSFLCFQQNETSSGVTYHAPQLAEIVRAARAHAPDMMIIVDAISGAFAHPLDFDALDVDLLLTGSQKGLGVSSGLAYGMVSDRAIARMLQMGGFEGVVADWRRDARIEAVVNRFERRQKVRYLGLLRMLLDQKRAEVVETPSVFHILSSLRALQQHDSDGGREAVLARHAAMGQRVRDGLADAGLRPVSLPPFQSDSVTPALVSDGASAPELRKQVQALYGIAIAGAQGDYWKAQMIRIGHLGFVYPADVARCLRALRVLRRNTGARGARADAPPEVVA